jgi:hypothetical protein
MYDKVTWLREIYTQINQIGLVTLVVAAVIVVAVVVAVVVVAVVAVVASVEYNSQFDTMVVKSLYHRYEQRHQFSVKSWVWRHWIQQTGHIPSLVFLVLPDIRRY